MELAQWRSRHIGFIFQFYNLLPVLTAYENVELPLLLTSLSRGERRRHVETALPGGWTLRPNGPLSQRTIRGPQQRVAIARAVITDPTIIVADEPTGDLDKNSAMEILGLMEGLNQEFGKTITMVTHDPRAAQTAHKRLFLDKGVLLPE